MLNIESGGNANALPPRPGFWRRQFQPQETTKRTVFDVLFGIALPVLCFIFDPIVFRGGFFGGEPLLGRLQFLAYSIAFIEISTLALWLCAGKRLREYAAAVGGFLYVGALVSFLIGVVILPFSLIGIGFFGLGLLGFTPFFTALVFWRNTRRAVNLHQESAGRGRRLAALALGLTFVIGFPLALHLKLTGLAQESLQKLLTGNAVEAEAASEQLRLIDRIVYTDTDKIIRAYRYERGPVRRERLARAYMRITGRSIDAPPPFMFD